MADKNDICTRHIRPLTPIATGVSPYLPLRRPYAAMLFDIYGTLLISDAGELGSNRWGRDTLDDLEKMLRRNNVDRSPEELMAALNRGIRSRHMIGQQSGVAFPEVDIVQVWEEVLGWDDAERLKAFALEIELIVNPVYPMPGMEALLAACRSGRVSLGIISNAQFYTPALLEWFFQGSLESRGFDRQLLFFSWKERQAKPGTHMFERARRVLGSRGVRPADVLFVGNDMRNDILPAAAVGFSTALFAGDRRSLRPPGIDGRIVHRSPDLVVTDLLQLVRFTQKNRCE